MKRTLFLTTFFFTMIGVFSAAAVEIPAAKLRAFKPLPSSMESAANPSSLAKIDLGRMLYYDHRLSKSQKFSCNSCHMLDKYGVDNEATSEGHKGQRGDRNSPTVYNAAGHMAQFWDGRAKDVEAQAKGPILNPVEMAMPDEKSVIVVLKSMPEYVALFAKAFPGTKDAVTYDNMANAIGAFERGLITPSRWDKFLAGDQKALTDVEKAGFLKFTEAGCAACHSGVLLGGSMYQKLGVVKPYPDTKDVGRAKVTKSEAEKFYFKVPSLRNVEKTGPYLHNGQTKTLAEAISAMGDYQLGMKLTAAEVGSIGAWLKSLTGEVPLNYIAKPKLPASTASTPRASAD
ncbi:MAG: c-type cytochrome [Bryobacterales bacterium]|nr:c-type cytochrome [Bryobacterales bacterium]